MNSANALTSLRIVLIPVFLVILYLDFPCSTVIALAVFIIACLTDALDGYVARKMNQVTNLGKFLDPLADKILVAAALAWFVENGQVTGWVLSTVLFREFAVSGLRLIAAEQGKVIAAGWSGKIKTASTMVCICALFLFNYPWVNIACQIIILGTTLYSGVEYFVRNLRVLIK